MAAYLVQKDNKLAIALIERIQNSNEPFVLCSTEELREFNNNVIVLPDKEVNQCEYCDRLRQAQRKNNFEMAKMAENAAFGMTNFNTTTKDI